MFTLHGHKEFVNSICFSADNLQMASCSQDTTVRIWCLHSGQELSVLKHDSEVIDVEFNMGGDRLVSSSRKGASLWSLQGEAKLLTFLSASEWLSIALFNPLNEDE